MSQLKRKAFWFSSLMAALVLISAILIQRKLHRLTSNETPATSEVLANVPADPTPTPVADGDQPVAPGSPTGISSDVQTIEDGNVSGSSAIPLSISEYPELGLPPVGGLHSLAAKFASEDPDPGWSTQMEGLLYDGVSQSGIAATTMQVGCRQSLCRVYISYPPGMEMSQLAFNQFSTLIDDLGFTVVPGFFGWIDRLPVRIMYLSREAESAP